MFPREIMKAILKFSGKIGVPREMGYCWIKLYCDVSKKK
jgi:hypothetical protein